MKKLEVGEKRPRSFGTVVNIQAKKCERDYIAERTVDFLERGGKIQHIESNIMKTDHRGSTALRINSERT